MREQTAQLVMSPSSWRAANPRTRRYQHARESSACAPVSAQVTDGRQLQEGTVALRLVQASTKGSVALRLGRTSKKQERGL